MIYIKEKEDIIKEKKYSTEFSINFFKNQKKHGDKLMIWTSGMSSHGFLLEKKGKDDVLNGWGYNGSYELGLGDDKSRRKLTVLPFFSEKKIKKCCCGSSHSLFLLEGGELYSCGTNYYGNVLCNLFNELKGQLCLSRKNMLQPASKVKHPKLVGVENWGNVKVDILDVYVGLDQSILLSRELEVYASGKNIYGQLGLGDKTNRSIPVKVNLPERIISASCGGFSTVFVSLKGNIYVTGKNEYGECGIDSTEKLILKPRKLLFFGEKTVIQVCAGWSNLIFLTSDNKVFSTGSNSLGSLGIGEKKIDYVETPTRVSALKDEKIVFVQTGVHSLFKSKKKIYMSGYNKHGQIGTKTTINVHTPFLISFDGEEVIQTSLLYWSTIHFTKSEAYGTGYNRNGELFFGDLTYITKLLKICDINVKRYLIHEKGIKKEMKERFEFLTSEFKKFELFV